MTDYKVADIDLAEFGRKEIRLAEAEIPALMALRRKYHDALVALLERGALQHKLCQ